MLFRHIFRVLWLMLVAYWTYSAWDIKRTKALIPFVP
jgi:hypothetical protein